MLLIRHLNVLGSYPEARKFVPNFRVSWKRVNFSIKKEGKKRKEG